MFLIRDRLSLGSSRPLWLLLLFCPVTLFAADFRQMDDITNLINSDWSHLSCILAATVDATWVIKKEMVK
jgi:hypothetical protein